MGRQGSPTGCQPPRKTPPLLTNQPLLKKTRTNATGQRRKFWHSISGQTRNAPHPLTNATHGRSLAGGANSPDWQLVIGGGKNRYFVCLFLVLLFCCSVLFCFVLLKPTVSVVGRIPVIAVICFCCRFLFVCVSDWRLFIERDPFASVCTLTLQNRGRGDVLSGCCGYYDEVIGLR